MICVGENLASDEASKNAIYCRLQLYMRSGSHGSKHARGHTHIEYKGCCQREEKVPGDTQKSIYISYIHVFLNRKYAPSPPCPASF